MLALLPALGCKNRPQELLVLSAASLARVFGGLEEELEQSHPGLDVQLEVAGSQTAVRKVAELGARVDVVAVADGRLIDELLRPSHARFAVHFAANELVLAHLEHSRYTDELTAQNWPEVLSRSDVRLGMVSPDLAPLGYRTLLLWQLAELELGRARTGPDLSARLRARCAPEHVAAHEAELLKLLQARAIDYAFVYRSAAEEHNLKSVALPGRYNLGVPEESARYARVAATLRGPKGTTVRLPGAPITYAVTIPLNAPHSALGALFLRELLGPRGHKLLERSGFRPLSPARVRPADPLPEPLRGLVRADPSSAP
ncbi:MAG: extracellular solute-binding protein [Deltaproteobacteria bacterium]|nr:extracellular solute-binding protein [Deltaproteobacteria bacterium]